MLPRCDFFLYFLILSVYHIGSFWVTYYLGTQLCAPASAAAAPATASAAAGDKSGGGETDELLVKSQEGGGGEENEEGSSVGRGLPDRGKATPPSSGQKALLGRFAHKGAFTIEFGNFDDMGKEGGLKAFPAPSAAVAVVGAKLGARGEFAFNGETSGGAAPLVISVLKNGGGGKPYTAKAAASPGSTASRAGPVPSSARPQAPFSSEMAEPEALEKVIFA